MIWAIKNWRVVVLVLSLVGIAGVSAYIYQKGRNDKQRDIEHDTMAEKIKTEEKFNEIRNTPLDFDGAIEWLRDHKL